jgi:hypothetical protein
MSHQVDLITLLVIILPNTIFPHALISLKFETYVKQFNYKLLFRMEEIGSSEFSAVGHYRHFRIALTRKVTQVEKIFYIPIMFYVLLQMCFYYIITLPPIN